MTVCQIPLETNKGNVLHIRVELTSICRGPVSPHRSKPKEGQMAGKAKENM